MADIQWLTTAPNPRSPSTGHDAGQRGWKTHAVVAKESQTFGDLAGIPAACGLRPSHGWGPISRIISAEAPSQGRRWSEPLIKMRRTDDRQQPGDFTYLEHGLEASKGLLMFVCPNGRHCSVATMRGGFRDGVPKRLGFDGNTDSPTLTPSIDCKACGWHGHITNGELLP